MRDRLPENCESEIVEPLATCQSIDWYAEGDSRTVQVGDVVITVRYVARKGRRGRIVIKAPAGAVFNSTEY